MQPPHEAEGGEHDSYQVLTRPQLIGTIASVFLLLLLASLDQTIVGTALPRIVAQIDGFELYAWVTTAYLLTETAAIPIFGKLSDLYGRKPFLLLGVVIFLAGSIGAGAAGDLPLPGSAMLQLVLARGVQGLGAGIIAGLAFTVIGDVFPPSQRGKMQGVFAGAFGFSAIFGPTLGGWITDRFSWRWIFYVNLPIGVAALLVLAFAFPYFRQEGVRRVIDWAGVATLIAGLVPLLLALEWAATHGWGSVRVLGLLAFALAMLALFLFVETRAEEPVIPLGLFRNRTIAIAAASLFLASMGMFGAILYLPLFMQGVIGISATNSGTLLTPLMLALIAGSIVGGQLASRAGRYKAVALAGLALTVAGLALMAGMGTGTTHPVILRNMILLGVGMGLAMPIYNVLAQNAVPRRLLGVASSTTNFARALGGTAGTAIFGSIMGGRYWEAFQARVPAGTPDEVIAPFENPLQIAAILPRLSELVQPLPNGQALLDGLQLAVKEALVLAINRLFLIGALLIAVAFVINWFLPRDTPVAAEEAAPLGEVETMLAGREVTEGR
jgi:EmrB/QacA subfamily drug resistance transporter